MDSMDMGGMDMNSMSLHSSAHMFTATHVALSSTTLLVWDHLITFDLEVAHIWKTRKSLLSVVFLINRYAILIGKLCTFVLLCPLMNDRSCRLFLMYEVALTLVGTNLVAFMMFLRIKALYQEQPVVVGIVAILGLLKFAMNVFVLATEDGQAVSLVCTMILNMPEQVYIMGWSFGWLPLIYDTAVLALTVYKLLPFLRNQQSSYVVKQLFQDGILYYFIIFAFTAVTNMLIRLLMDGPTNVAVQQFGLIITVSMMSRFTLNLKDSAQVRKGNSVLRPVGRPISGQPIFNDGKIDPAIKDRSTYSGTNKRDSGSSAIGGD